MEDGFIEFYKTLDKNSFKYFVRNEGYYVYGDELKYFGNANGLLKIEEHVLENVIREVLTVHKLKVEEYENFKRTKEGFPGNWKDFMDVMLDKALPPSICSIQIEGTFCTTAFLNTFDKTVYTCSFEDDDVFSGLCSLLSEINAFEIIYSDTVLEPLIASLGILSHRVPKGSAVDALATFLKVPVAPSKEYVRPLICRIDSSTLESLNVYKPKERGVVDTFNCVTNQGHRLLLQFIKNPLRSQSEIEYRLDIVDCLRSVDLSILKQFPDLLRLTKRIQNNKITIQELLRLHQVINKVPLLLDSLSVPRLMNDFYKPLEGLMGSLKDLQKRLEETIDVEASKRNIYRVQQTSLDLQACYTSVQEKIKNEYLRILKLCDRVKYDEASNLFKLTRVEYRQVEELLKSKNILVTNFLKTGVYFTTKSLSELNAEREEVLERIKREERVILESLKEFVKGKCAEIEVLNYLTSLLDVFNAFASKALLPGYCRPTFAEGQIKVKGLFHPLLETSQFIPNDFEVDQKKMVIITGPNMGGKSTYLKSLGVVSLLAQIGCYVPCSYALLPIYDGVYVRMGASDCAHTGDSTFMLEMKDISRIIRNSTFNSLVLIDELGRGTSEIDGLSLALSVRDHLMSKGCVTLFATHFPELNHKEGVVNKKVDSDGVLLLYKIVDGVCDKSFGINVAKKVGFPDDVIENILNYCNNE